ncbi:MAG: hypothetical protein KKB79_00840 [Nanoarchaeota archaeon]|nr:hypothetical protein [Nanoarchaeota archaeon]
MNDLEIIQRAKRYYQDTIKPLLEKESPLARLELSNLGMAFQQGAYAQISKEYHHGDLFTSSINILVKSLSEGKFDSEAVRRFEMEMSQLELAIKAGNTY